VVAGTAALVVAAGVALRLLPLSSPQPPRPLAAPPPPAPAAFVTVELEGAPEGVVVLVDGIPGPLPIRLPRSADKHQLEFRAPGRRPVNMTLDGTKDRSLSLMMPAAAEPPGPTVEAPAKRGRPARRAPARSATPEEQPSPRKSKDVILDL
jgi:hypothetical protein